MNAGEPELWLPPLRRAEGTYILRISLASGSGVAARLRIKEVVALFAMAANHGAFPVTDVRPAASRLLTSEARTGSAAMEFHLDARGVDFYAFECLRNMVGRLAEEGIVASRVAVFDPSAARQIQLKPLPTDDLELESYPDVSALASAELSFEESDFALSRRCVAELGTPVSAGHVDRLRSWTEPWFSLLEAAAFAQPVGNPLEITSLSGDVTLFDAVSIEITVNRFQASEAAWYPLVNMLDACFGEVSLCRSIVID